MKRVKIIGAVIAVALGAGAVAGGYTCVNTNLCNRLKK